MRFIAWMMEYPTNSAACLACAAALFALVTHSQAAGETMAGPLRVHPENPRYFTNDTGRPVYLTGSHTWDVLRDSYTDEMTQPFDYTGFLDMMVQNNHNFLRMWAWDLPKSQCGNDPVHYYQQFPWPRTGPGLANDGKPKFDLSQLDDSYFERLRARVIAARQRGIYVAVMLFEGYGVQFCRSTTDGHPFDAANNINGIGSAQSALTTGNPAAWAVQTAYMRRVVDTVNDLDNVLYEIANEAGGNSVPWQFAMIDALNAYQNQKPKKHPVGMTFAWQGGDNPSLFASAADWISPGGGADPYGTNPPAADGTKVVISDSDHIYGTSPEADFRWVWRSFTRGLQPILMEDMKNRPDQIGSRSAMGHTLAYARRIDLAKNTPRGSLSSTGYCLANPGFEYLVYQNESGAFTVNVEGAATQYTVEWFNPAGGGVQKGASVTGGAQKNFTPPFAGPAVLYLRGDTLPPEPTIDVRLTLPEPETSFLDRPVDIDVRADASDRFGTIETVEFFANGTSLGTATGPQFEIIWEEASPGLHTLTAEALNDTGQTRTSVPLLVQVGSPPAIHLFRVDDGIVSFLLMGRAGAICRVDVSENLLDWNQLIQVTLISILGGADGSALVEDTAAAGHLRRFYRASEVP